ncbi:MAG: PF20097 family protein [Planctomycetaceae bacterium]|nr:PF20097 family protein [Planctomycetaceae bacterium]
MPQTLHCPLCGSDKVEPGTLQSGGEVHFRPDRAKFLKTESANIEMTGLLCTQCGNVTLLGDTSQIPQTAENSLFA